MIVAHGTEKPYPLFNYGNAQALALFETSPEAFAALESRRSAPLDDDATQAERAALLARVRRDGFAEGYSLCFFFLRVRTDFLLTLTF